jgi:tungstate transport system permease protein
METFFSAFAKAFGLIAHPTGELIWIVALSLQVSGLALLLAVLVGLPLGALVGLKRFRLRGLVIAVLNAFMGLPPVVVGLLIFIILSRSGPLGFMGLLYSPSAMVCAQFVLALPIITALTHSAVVGVNPSIGLAARTLGATPGQVNRTIIFEARYGIMSGTMAALGRVMGEVGAVLIVGGNIAGYTRVMTTTIALETDKGDFSLALALGMILLVISIGINMALHFFQTRTRHAA